MNSLIFIQLPCLRASQKSIKWYGIRVRLPIRILLFLSSYAPLFFLTAISQKGNDALGGRSIFTFKILSLVLFSLMLLGIIAAWLVIHQTNKTASTTLNNVKAVGTDNQDTVSYLITYLVPFIGLSFQNPAVIVANGFLIIFVGILYLQSNMIYLNPTLGLFGYRLYRVELDNSISKKILLARTLPESGNKITARLISKEIYLHD